MILSIVGKFLVLEPTVVQQQQRIDDRSCGAEFQCAVVQQTLRRAAISSS